MPVARSGASRALILAVSALALFAASASASSSARDTSFGNGGILRKTFNTDWGDARNVVVQPDGKIIIAAHGYETAGSNQDQFLARFNPDGTLDGGFGVGGLVYTSYSSDDDVIRDITLLADGRIVTVGASDWDSNDDPTVTRYLSTGALDNSFSGDGKLEFEADSAGGEGWAEKVAIQADGKIVVAGTVFRSPDYDMFVTRFDSAGVADPGFNGGTPRYRHVFEGMASSNDSTHGLVIQPDQSIVLLGEYQASVSEHSAILQSYTSAGAPNSTFANNNVNGSRLLAVGAGHKSPTDLISQPDGKLVVLFNNSVTAFGTIGVTRWDANANAVDNSFGDSGFAAFGVALTGINSADFVRLADGSFLIGGRSFGTQQNPLFAKLSAGGAPDTSFGIGGVADIDSGNGGDVFDGVAVQPDGKYLGVGQIYDPPSIATATAQIVRVLGDYVAPPAPPVVPAKATAKIKSPAKKKIKASKFKSVSGTATGVGITRVEVAIQRIDSKLLKKKKRCLYVKNSKGRTKSYKAVKKKCAPSKFLVAKGTTSWKYSLKLKPGKYKLSVQAVNGGGTGKATFKEFTITK